MVQTGVYPSKLKRAKVIPVYKTGDRTEPGNYRPISLLSVFNRLFERLMHKRLTSFIEKEKFFVMHSIVSEKTVLLNRQFWILSTEYKVIWRQVCSRATYFIDLKKAFDKVDHSVLLCKSSKYGIRGIINDWFVSYLTNRTQTTQVEASISSKGKTLFGVP